MAARYELVLIVFRTNNPCFSKALWNKGNPQKGKISAQPHTIVKQICFPNGNVLF